MKFKEKKHIPPKYILLIFTAICLILLVLSLLFENTLTPLKLITGNVITPMQSGINDIGLWVNSKLDNFTEVESLRAENDELKSKIEEYSSSEKTYQQDLYELDRLRELYRLDEKYPNYNMVAARVIAKDSGNWFNVFVIDKGSKDGIEVDANVMAGNGLAGIVTKVGPHWASVRAIIDDTNNVSGMITDDETLCIVAGNLASIEHGYIDVEYIDKEITVTDGDEVVTSNIDNKYLPGLTIGYIKDVKLDSNNLTQSGKLTPAVDFKNLQEVLVITDVKKTVE